MEERQSELACSCFDGENSSAGDPPRHPPLLSAADGRSLRQQWGPDASNPPAPSPIPPPVSWELHPSFLALRERLTRLSAAFLPSSPLPACLSPSPRGLGFAPACSLLAAMGRAECAAGAAAVCMLLLGWHAGEGGEMAGITGEGGGGGVGDSGAGGESDGVVRGKPPGDACVLSLRQRRHALLLLTQALAESGERSSAVVAMECCVALQACLTHTPGTLRANEGTVDVLPPDLVTAGMTRADRLISQGAYRDSRDGVPRLTAVVATAVAAGRGGGGGGRGGGEPSLHSLSGTSWMPAWRALLLAHARAAEWEVVWSLARLVQPLPPPVRAAGSSSASEPPTPSSPSPSSWSPGSEPVRSGAAAEGSGGGAVSRTAEGDSAGRSEWEERQRAAAGKGDGAWLWVDWWVLNMQLRAAWRMGDHALLNELMRCIVDRIASPPHATTVNTLAALLRATVVVAGSSNSSSGTANLQALEGEVAVQADAGEAELPLLRNASGMRLIVCLPSGNAPFQDETIELLDGDGDRNEAATVAAAAAMATCVSGGDCNSEAVQSRGARSISGESADTQQLCTHPPIAQSFMQVVTRYVVGQAEGSQASDLAQAGGSSAAAPALARAAPSSGAWEQQSTMGGDRRPQDSSGCVAGGQPAGSTLSLDLHGLHAQPALMAMCLWLNRVLHRGRKQGPDSDEVEVITGRGNGSRVQGASRIASAVLQLAAACGLPLRRDPNNAGRFIAQLSQLRLWKERPCT